MIYFPWNLEAGDESAIGECAYIYNLGRVTIGARATISHRAHLCAGTHDHTKSDFLLLRPPIFVGDQSWVCADAFLGPGITIGKSCDCRRRCAGDKGCSSMDDCGRKPGACSQAARDR